MKIRGVDFVVYEVNNLQQSIEFYRDTLGLNLTWSSDEYGFAEFDLIHTTLALYCPLIAESRPPRTGGAAVAIAVESVANAVAELREKGVEIRDPVDTPVCHMAFFQDPDGNAVGLHQRKDGTAG